jgi:hypothetical protein
LEKHVMPHRTGNLSDAERAISALAGIAFTLLSLRRGSAAVRALSGVAGAALAARALAGHCGIKSALQGRTSFAGGLADQWGRMSGRLRSATDGLPGSPVHASKSDAIDQSVDQSFPASDAPASRIPDVPPVNADAKWAAARAAEGSS